MHPIRCVSIEASVHGAAYKKAVPEQLQRELGIRNSEGGRGGREEIERAVDVGLGQKEDNSDKIWRGC